MKKAFSNRLNRLKLFGSFLGIIFLFNSSLTAQPFKLSAVSDMVQIFEDGYNMPASSDTVQVFGIRGEILSGQCVISTKANLTDVKVEVSLLENPKTSSLIPPCTVEWNFVGSIPLLKNAGLPQMKICRCLCRFLPRYRC